MSDTSVRRHVTPEIWQAVAARARRQHGVISHEQLLSAGLSSEAIERLVASGRLERLHKQVYAIAHAPLTFRGHAMAALLACADDGAVNARAAATLHRMLRPADLPIDVTSTSRRGGREPGIRLHRVRSLPEEHVMRLRGMRVTRPARTLLDLAECYPSELGAALNEALVLRIVDEAELRAIIRESTGRRGVKPLKAALDGDPEPTLSEIERRALRLIREAKLPQPIVNRHAAKRMVDLHWRLERVIVELDGWSAHGTRSRFESDRARDSALAAQGWIVLRFTWRRLQREPLAVIAEIAAVLAIRRPAELV